MRNIQESILSMLREHSTRKHLAAVVCMIAIATAFAVFWSLRISGITLTSDDPICGLQEHTHTDACYDWVATVTDGTEEIKSTDETETTEAVEIIDETETVETVEITGTTEAEEATDEASAEESAEAYESASVEEDTSIAEETATEAVTGVTETGTESVTETPEEDATEEMTEELTEEETETPQPGDTKVVDGVTYVYELVCGMEEHTHTDECYESDASEDTGAEDDSDAETKVVDGVSENGADDEAVSEDGSDELLLTDEATETASSVTAGLSKSLYSTRSLLMGTSDVSESGISVASDEDETSTSTGDTYYFVDSATLATAAANQDESYIVYTIIDGNYYVVSAEDGSLLKCTDLTAYTSSDDKVSNSSNVGIYVWEIDSETNEPVFKFTTNSTDDDFADYRWKATSTSDLGNDGSGDYTLYNSENQHYLASGRIVYTDSFDQDNTLLAGQAVPLEENGRIEYDVTFTRFRHSSLASFYLDLYDNSGNKVDIYVYKNSAYTTITNNLSVTAADSSASYTTYTYGTLSMTAGDVYEIEIIVNDAAVLIIIHNETQGENYYYVINGLKMDDKVYSQFSVNYGTFSTSAEVFTISGSNENGTSISNSSTEDGSYTLTSGAISAVSDTVKTITGDFDVTYTFNNKSNGSENYENFVIELNNNAGVYITVRADNAEWLAYTTVADDTEDTFEILTTSFNDWTTWNSTMAGDGGTSCTARVIRYGNTFLIITTSAGHTSIAYAEVSDFDSTVANVYLAGENCTISDITYTNNTASEYIYSVVSSNDDPITLTANTSDAYSWTVDDAGSSSENIYLQGSVSDGTAALAWMTGTSSSAGSSTSTSMTFALASVREYTVFFDGQNGGSESATNGVIYYRGAGQITKTTSIDATGETYTVEVPNLTYTPYTSAYVQYKLRGWVNIYTGVYYDIETYEGASVAVGAGNTVFYADWLVADYNIGQENKYTVDVPDTSNYIKTYLFDYNDILNFYSASLDTETTELTSRILFVTSLSSTSHSERWISNSTSGLLTAGSSILSNSLNFLFLGAGNVGSLAYTDGRSGINSSNTVDGNANNAYLGVIKSGIIGSVGSEVTTSNNELLKALFGRGNTIDDLTSGQTYGDAILGKTYVGEGYNLFQYNDDTGYYYYDSTKNAAAYNQEKETFYVYEYTEMTDASNGDTENYSDFLPFNYSSSATTDNVTSYNVYTVDYWFGMQTEIDFYLPNDSSSSGSGVANQSANGNDMVFKFSGDDDVWVCVDDVLVLDLGGMHGAVYGEINFSTGEITIGQSGATKTTDTTTDTIDITGDIGVTTTSMDFTKGTHTLTVYYLERGASQSNMAIYFNISPIYSVEMTKVGESAEELGNVTFNLYSSSAFTDEYLVKENITTNSSGYLRIDELTPLKTYYLVETSAASGYPLTHKYITIYVDSAGKATVKVHSSDGTTELEQLTCEAEGSVNALSDYRYLLQTLSVNGTSDDTYGRYYLVKFTYANYLEYELPDTGSMGVFPYRRAGTVLVLVSITGLLITAFYHLVWVRKLRTSVNNKGYTEEKRKRGNHFARTRDHPRERSEIHGRDAPEALAHGILERSRGTGPGSK